MSPFAIWKNLSLAGAETLESATFRNRIIITNQLAIINTFILSGSILLFFAIGQVWLGALLVPFTVVNAFVLALHLRKLYNIGRVVYCTNITLMIYAYASLTGDYTGIFLYFYPLCIYPIILFEAKEWRYTLALLVVVLGLYVAYHLRVRVYSGALVMPMDDVALVGKICIFGSMAFVVGILFLDKYRIAATMLRMLGEEKAKNQRLQEQDIMILRQDAILRRNQQELQEKTILMEKSQQQLADMVAELKRNQTALALQQHYDKGVAELAEATRWTPDSQLKVWAQNVLSFLAQFVNASQGTFYVVQQANDAKLNGRGKDYLQLVAGYALIESNGAPARINPGEGLLGALLHNPAASHLTQLDDNGSGHLPTQTHTLRTAGGELVLKELFVLPLIYNEELVGAIELANVHAFTTPELFFLRRIGTRLGAALAGIYVNEEIRLSN